MRKTSGLLSDLSFSTNSIFNVQFGSMKKTFAGPADCVFVHHEGLEDT